jgi:hypothetical protein
MESWFTRVNYWSVTSISKELFILNFPVAAWKLEKVPGTALKENLKKKPVWK